jgi:hypothetical protein
MIDKVIHVDFTKNKKRNKKTSFLSMLKNLLRKVFSSTNKPSDPDGKKNKVIYYRKGIS